MNTETTIKIKRTDTQRQLGLRPHSPCQCSAAAYSCTGCYMLESERIYSVLIDIMFVASLFLHFYVGKYYYLKTLYDKIF